MNLNFNIETYVSVAGIIITALGSIYVIWLNKKTYGSLFLISAIVGEILCYIFISIGFYSFPYRLFPSISSMPFFIILTVFPFLVLLGVRYSPTSWAYKIPFYWVIVHLGMFAETWAQTNTKLIEYELFWDVWDSYTWWWIYLLIFEWVGGLIVSKKDRNPVDEKLLEYGKIGWFIIHFILITTIFLAGFYMGKIISLYN
ncbi:MULTISPECIES: CBO0543 family protein [unclassified Candidatus Frackibacter]|uniref:CBO0543 family protein n=1 Tax=unclassified Candidatus Frackibacter TaxID=2648818 RepID=UPI00088CD2CC|nr:MULTISPECIES: CBO0543 family protein [unclassified Candidatus Frackibacter]SDC68622.1 hypothetical protein SAMN04515661_11936 [Candidatus Frackibacter sp. WG11]SEM83067.1 hypothetical protein SAMN04488698_11927 [Candidatus Frackibacter sp. WG12]SFL92217.1 hypothetical protein SAMN04488699_12036 [Candidatus Frackibacter sp. WG13]